MRILKVLAVILFLAFIVFFIYDAIIHSPAYLLQQENAELTKQVELQQKKLETAWEELAAANQLNMDYFDRICKLEGQVWELERLNSELMDILGY